MTDEEFKAFVEIKEFSEVKELLKSGGYQECVSGLWNKKGHPRFAIHLSCCGTMIQMSVHDLSTNQSTTAFVSSDALEIAVMTKYSIRVVEMLITVEGNGGK